MTANGTRYQLGQFVVDLDRREVRRNGSTLGLGWRHFEALRILMEARGEVVAKEEFFRRLWPDSIVDETNLTKCISHLRKALNDVDPAEIYVETVPRLGYRLAPPLAAVAEAEAPPGRPRRAIRFDWRLLAAALVMIAAGSGIWGWSWFQRREKRRQAEIAHEEGRTLMRQRNQKSAGEAIPRLIRAIDLDPSYGLAYATLSQAISRQGRPSVPLANGQPLTALGAAQRGVEVDPNCGQCQGSFGFFLFFHNWRWSEADDHLRRAVELEPQTASIRPSYAMLLSVTGRGEEALRQVDEAVRRVPYQAGYHTVRAGVLYLLRRYEESVAAADHAISLSPLERQAWEWRSRAMFLLGRPEEGLKSMAENIFAAHALDLERAWKDGGAEGGLRKLLAITSDWRSAEIQSWRRAGWKTLLGDTEGALDELETAFRIRSTNLLYIGLDPGYDRLRSHPRFQRILDGLGLAAELQRHRR